MRDNLNNLRNNKKLIGEKWKLTNYELKLKEKKRRWGQRRITFIKVNGKSIY